jgi:hypothetical protein
MHFINSFIISLYNYCTDFIINLTSLTSLSYYEINALIFLLIWPAFTITLLCIRIKQLIQKKGLK